MSGAGIPYHLRPNKAVDRNAFIECLQHISSICDIKKYRYVSLGGPFLEDLKLIHTQLGINDLVSLEQADHVFKRQNFNMPLNCIECLHKNSGEYIDENDFSNVNYIIWLDYASSKERPQQLTEIATLLGRLKEFDILKITMNANPDTFGSVESISEDTSQVRRTPTAIEKSTKRLNTLRSQINKSFIPSDLDNDALTKHKIPITFSRIIQKVANESLKDSLLYAQPITAFHYTDSSHQMFTITLILLSKKDDNKQREIINRIDQWGIGTTQWAESQEINMPELTAKERLCLDSFLPHSSPDEIIKKLPFSFAENQNEELSKIKCYKRYYRLFPHFSRVLL